MGLFDFISIFWKDNKVSYLVACVVFSLVGFIVYAATESNYQVQNYLVLLPLFWIGIYIFALCFTFLSGGGKD